MIITNLLTNMIVLNLSGAIPTNTPAFQKYAFQTMFTNAQVIASKWNLDQTLIASNKVTSFWAEPYASGTAGGILFDKRYGFIYRNGKFSGFGDNAYTADFMSGEDDKKINIIIKQWLSATNILTKETAKDIAISAMRSIGLTDDANFKEPRAEQLLWHLKEESRFLPYYTFDWKSTVIPAVSEALGFTNIVLHEFAEIDVSGLNGRVVHFEQNSPYLKMAKPANYLEMLGLPPNTIFVKKKPTPSGQPPVYEIFPP